MWAIPIHTIPILSMLKLYIISDTVIIINVPNNRNPNHLLSLY